MTPIDLPRDPDRSRGRPDLRMLADGSAVDLVVEADRAQLGEVVQRVRDGRLRPNIGTVAAIDDAVSAFDPVERATGKTIIRVRPQGRGTDKEEDFE